jgi:L-alanine-DL-glutamate epimerase-like enolase superfamily enzyme
MKEIRAVADSIASGLTRLQLQTHMKPGAARNAVDCALWDLEAKLTGQGVADTIGAISRDPLVTAFTLSLAEPEAMAAEAHRNAHRPLLKVKLGTDTDEARLRAVRQAAPSTRLIIDANEGWTADNLAHYMAIAAEANVSLIEQPLPVGQDAALAGIHRLVSVCADESVHATGDLESLRDRYDAVNIKLDKTGGARHEG